MPRVYKFEKPSPGAATLLFLDMSPSPAGPRTQVAYFVRTQVNGASIYLDGTRGDMQQIRTLADAENAIKAEQLVKLYEASCAYVWEITYDSVSYGNYLLDSVVCDASPIVKMIGGKNHADPKYLVEAQWNIFPITSA